MNNKPTFKMKNYKTLEDNIKLDDFGVCYDFLDTTPKTWSMKEIMDKLDFMKI